jgi:putative colanic acid biosynthesis acetyltransferase WcaF
MALITKPIRIEHGAWVTSRCVVLGGAVIGQSALVQPMTVVRGEVPANAIVGGPKAAFLGNRFESLSE